MRTSEVLDRAAGLIERDGWCKLVIGNGSRRCALGAIIDADADTDRNAVAHAHAVLCDSVGGAVGTWNDACDTAAEVIAMLRAVAATERARERTEIAPRMLPVVCHA